MKASELRIGNLVKANYRGISFICDVVKVIFNEIFVKGIMDDDKCEYEFSGDPEKYAGKENGFEPIPLTEEWLVRFGFEFEKYTESIIANKSDLALLKMVGWKYFTFTTNLGNGKNEYCKDIICVHQLQNLFYSITGEELTISDPVFINSL